MPSNPPMSHHRRLRSARAASKSSALDRQVRPRDTNSRSTSACSFGDRQSASARRFSRTARLALRRRVSADGAWGMSCQLSESTGSSDSIGQESNTPADGGDCSANSRSHSANRDARIALAVCSFTFSPSKFRYLLKAWSSKRGV